MSTSEHYPLVQTDELCFSFATDGGSKYELVFVFLPSEQSIPLYTFNIERLVDGKHLLADSIKIRNTIAFALQSFFENIDNAILSTCEVDDGKQFARKKLFDRWFNQLNDGNVLMMETQVDSGIGMTWATMYYHKDNMFRSLLETMFHELT